LFPLKTIGLFGLYRPYGGKPLPRSIGQQSNPYAALWACAMVCLHGFGCFRALAGPRVDSRPRSQIRRAQRSALAGRILLAMEEEGARRKVHRKQKDHEKGSAAGAMRP